MFSRLLLFLSRIKLFDLNQNSEDDNTHQLDGNFGGAGGRSPRHPSCRILSDEVGRQTVYIVM